MTPDEEPREGAPEAAPTDAPAPDAAPAIDAAPAPAPAPAPAARPGRLALAGVAAVALLALVEAGVALTAPLRTPSPADWRRAAAHVRGLKRPGDLIVVAPAWADPLLRLYLGDQITMAEAGRMDAARYGRLVELSVRGGRAPETRAPGVRQIARARFGGVTVTTYEQPRAEVVFDFLERWREAHVSRWRQGREEIACVPQGETIQCPGVGFNHVALRVLEPDYTAKRCLYVQPVDRAEVRLSFTATLGTVLAGATGLHDYHQRKTADGQVLLRVLIDGTERLRTTQGSKDGWKLFRLDTAALAGGPHEVTFEVSSPRPYGRHFCFAAEARR
ncbi:MAG TPA: hypothetical protein VGQ83_14310 [Polyangia bacterium]|jgi:hypothetical protein